MDHDQLAFNLAVLRVNLSLTPVYFAATKEQLLQSAVEQTVCDLLRFQKLHSYRFAALALDTGSATISGGAPGIVFIFQEYPI